MQQKALKGAKEQVHTTTSPLSLRAAERRGSAGLPLRSTAGPQAGSPGLAIPPQEYQLSACVQPESQAFGYLPCSAELVR